MSEKKSVIHAYTRFCLLLAVAAGTARGDVAALMFMVFIYVSCKRSETGRSIRYWSI